MVKMIPIPTKFKLIAGAVIIVCVSLFVWHYKTLREENTSLKLQLSAANETIKKHQENILITESANHDFQNDIAVLNSDIRRLRAKQIRCIPITGAADIHNGSGSRGEHDNADGISSEWLYEYAIDAEKLRIDRNACKKFVNDVWDLRQ